MVLYLNARKQLIHKETISIGTLTETLVHPREVFEPAIRLENIEAIERRL
jgi:DNA repair protein RadC